MASQTLPVVSGDKDRSLQDALGRLTDSRAPLGRDADPIVTAAHRLPAVAAAFAPFPDETDDRLRGALAARGVDQLYTHQAEAFQHVLAGRNVVTITPTASGKTLCYNAPVLNAILKDPSTRALPTKALAQDQLAELHGLSQLVTRDTGVEISVSTYDGDTPSDARRAIRGKAHVVLSNPDMVHSGILPHHPRWAKLFENLKFVVVDELHAYRGVFGSHLANILRRLRRVCRHYGSDPIFICSSATIANPRELAEGLTGSPFELVEKNGAPRGEKFFLFVNPPMVNAELGIRRSYLAETRRVALEFLRHNLQLIVFAQSRLAVEILTTYLKDAFHGPPGAADVIRGYRGGYLPNRRREIERGLRDAQVRAVVSTNALELGIDIGALDVSVMAGYPGTIAATWQRAGRAGRRTTRSAAVLVASSAPIDQFVVRNPSYFFDGSPEHALINPDNLHILVDHVKCAAFELPFAADDEFGGVDVQQVLSVLSEEGFVHHADGQWNWTNESYPADAVRCPRTTSSSSTRRTASGSLAKPTSRAARPRSTRKPSTSSRDSCSRSSASTSTDARRTCGQWIATITRTRSPIRRSPSSTRSQPKAPVRCWEAGRRCRAAATAKCTWCRASSGSRRSSSTRTRTWVLASWICRSSRCTRLRTG
jgi:DEAD/DEAH box helicase domain-containing protein